MRTRKNLKAKQVIRTDRDNYLFKQSGSHLLVHSRTHSADLHNAHETQSIARALVKQLICGGFMGAR